MTMFRALFISATAIALSFFVCSARPGCGFVDGGCYCRCRGMGQTALPDGDEADGCNCECAGGPPPSCRAQP